MNKRQNKYKPYPHNRADIQLTLAILKLPFQLLKWTWKQFRRNKFIFFMFLLVACSEGTPGPYKDLEITFPEEYYAKFRIYDSNDSSLVISDEFDREYVESLHYSTIEKGDYYLKAESGLKRTYLDFHYNGKVNSIAVFF